MIIDTIAHEYSYTLDQILKMTSKEIVWRMKAITERLNNEREFLAGLHQMEINKKQEIPIATTTNKQNKMISKCYDNRFKRN